MFDLKRPCGNCPFRKGVGSTFRLGRERLRHIFNAPAFQCHKTVDYSDHDPAPGERPQQCAGLIAVLYRSNRDNQIMQVAERLVGYDASLVDPDGQAYGSIAEAEAAHIDGKEPG